MVRLTGRYKINKISKQFNGLSFVITGSFKNLSRSQIKKILEELGGRVSGSVSKNTSYLVLGENPGSKFKKASELGIQIIDENGLNSLLKGDLPN